MVDAWEPRLTMRRRCRVGWAAFDEHPRSNGSASSTQRRDLCFRGLRAVGALLTCTKRIAQPVARQLCQFMRASSARGFGSRSIRGRLAPEQRRRHPRRGLSDGARPPDFSERPRGRV